MAGRVEQAAVVVLPMDLDQPLAHLAHQSGRRRLVVDGGATAPVGAQLALEQQRLARLHIDAVLVQQRRDRACRRVEGGGDDPTLRPAAHQAAVGARAQRQAQRVQQDRLARPRFSGQHAQPAVEFDRERLDQDDVADGERAQHGCAQRCAFTPAAAREAIRVSGDPAVLPHQVVGLLIPLAVRVIGAQHGGRLLRLLRQAQGQVCFDQAIERLRHMAGGLVVVDDLWNRMVAASQRRRRS